MRPSASSNRTSSDTLADALEVRLARTPAEVSEALALRERVFAGEQGVPIEADRDGRDQEAVHVVALGAGDAEPEQAGRVVGTCRLLFRRGEARLGRLAVDPTWRRRGVGAAVLLAAERAAVDAGARRVRLHAQLAAKGLYDRAGYAQRGGVFIEEGIEHVSMEKRIA